MSIQESMAKLALAALSRKAFLANDVPELADSAFFGDDGTGAVYIPDFCEALAAAGSDEIRTSRILTAIKAVDDSANEGPTGIFIRTRKRVSDLEKGELSFLVSYLKATRGIDADPEEKELVTRVPPFVPPPPNRGQPTAGKTDQASVAIPAKTDGWMELHDALHALFVRYEGRENRVLLEIRALVKAQADPAFRAIADRYVTERTINPRLMKDPGFLRHFGVPVDPEPAATVNPEPPPAPVPDPVPSETQAWTPVLDALHALFVRHEENNPEALPEIRALVAAQTDPVINRFAKKYVFERSVDKRVAAKLDFIRHFGVPAIPIPEPVVEEPDAATEPPPAPELSELEKAIAEIDALFVEHAAGVADAATRMFALRDEIPTNLPRWETVARYIDRRFAGC